MKKTVRRRLWPLLTTLMILVGLCSIGFAASAEEHVIISIHNTSPGTDINPFLRFFVKKDKFGSGGPFTVKVDVKVENFKRMSTTEGPSCFLNVLTLETNQGKQEGQQVSILKNTDGWVDMKRADGEYVTLSNVDKGCLIDGVKQDYYLVDFGIYYLKADVYFSNFRVENAAGKVVYSWDTDPDLQALMNDAAANGKDKANLRDIGLINPEPYIVGTGFGNNASQIYVYKGDAGTATTSPNATTKAPIYEDPDDTTAPADSTTATDETTADTTENTENTTESTESTAATTSSTAPVGGVTTSPSDGEKGGGLGVGAIIGIVAGAVVVLGGGTFGVLFAMKKLPFQHAAEAGGTTGMGLEDSDPKK